MAAADKPEGPLAFDRSPAPAFVSLVLAIAVPFAIARNGWQNAPVIAAGVCVGFLVCRMVVVPRGDRVVVGFSRAAVLSLGALMIFMGIVDYAPVGCALLGYALGLASAGVFKRGRVIRELQRIEADL